jgi:next-to-BRCA1 protein 1
MTADDLPEEKPVVSQAPVEVEASKPEKATEPTTYEPVSAFKSVCDNFHAYFVRDAIPDGTRLPPNTMFRQTWTLYNPGPSAWPVGSDVRFVGGDTMFNVDASHPSSVESIHAAMESNKLNAPVEVGQSADFTVTLRTPRREGTAISYWRLKLPNGEAIGHRLWCDIQVQASFSGASSDAEAEPETTPQAGDWGSPVPDHARLTSSGMIFPKLEKESPESSTHEAAAPVHQPPTVSTLSEADVMEDVESLTLDEASTDAGFPTDDEWDVLDASDQEFLDAKQSAH